MHFRATEWGPGWSVCSLNIGSQPIWQDILGRSEMEQILQEKLAILPETSLFEDMKRL